MPMKVSGRNWKSENLNVDIVISTLLFYK